MRMNRLELLKQACEEERQRVTTYWRGQLMEKDRKNVEMLRKKDLQLRGKEDELRDVTVVVKQNAKPKIRCRRSERLE